MAEKGINNGNGEAELVTSSCLSSSVAGVVSMSRLSQNPFAIKTTTPTRSVADSTDCKESRPLLAPPTLVLGSEGGCTVSSSANKIVLRPSALSLQTDRLRLTGVPKSEPSGEDKENVSRRESGDSREVSSSCEAARTPSEENNCSTDGIAHPKLPHTDSIAGLAHDDQSQSSHGTTAPEGFVFGQNLHERAANYEETESDSSLPSSTELSFNQFQTTNSNSSEPQPEQPGAALNRYTKSLSESAEEYQSRQVKRKYDQVEVVTGEENESNVLQINCKLFSFDKISSAWHERGRGILRLNDKEIDGVLQSRLVMRTQGSLRVIMNTKVWAGMVVEHPSPKSVRTSAIDQDTIRVYLVQANAKDAEQLYNALNWRVQTLKSSEEPSRTNFPGLRDCSSNDSAADSSVCEAEGAAGESSGSGAVKKPRMQVHFSGTFPDSSDSRADSGEASLPPGFADSTDDSMKSDPFSEVDTSSEDKG